MSSVGVASGATTAVQDRTAEFKSCVASLAKMRGGATVASARQGLNQAGSSPGGTPGADGTPRSKRSEFSQRAGAIAQDIAETTGMLQRLALLAKRKTLFDDRPVEITELTYVIKQRVNRINDAIAQLQAFSKNASKGSAWGRSGADAQVGEHAKNVVVLLQGRLSDVTSGFAEVLETRTKNIQASKSRTEQFISSAAASVRDQADSPLYGGGAGASSAARSQTASPQNGGTGAGQYAENPYGSALASAEASSSDVLMLPNQQQSQVLLEEQQSQYMQSRHNAVEAIESTIQELGGIFSQLATMVAEQRETVQRIDANTEDVAINVSGAQRELLKYYARVSSNRWLMIKCFGIIIVRVVLVFFFSLVFL